MSLKIFNFQLFKLRLNMLSFTPTRTIIIKSLAIVSRHLLKSMWAGNLYLGPFEITERIRESVIIFKLAVTI